MWCSHQSVAGPVRSAQGAVGGYALGGARRRAAAVVALNMFFAERGSVFLPGDLHSWQIVHCSHCRVLDKRRPPLEFCFDDAEGRRTVIRLLVHDNRLLTQETGLDLMVQMTHDWQARGLPVHCRSFRSQLCEISANGEFTALIKGHPERETLFRRGRAETGAQVIPSPEVWMRGVLAFDRMHFVNSLAGMVLFQAVFVVHDLHNDNVGVSDRGDLALHEIWNLLAPRRSKFFGSRAREVFTTQSGILLAAKVDVNEFANVCVRVLGAVSYASLLPFLLGRLGNTPNVMRWASSSHWSTKELADLIKETRPQTCPGYFLLNFH